MPTPPKSNASGASVKTPSAAPSPAQASNALRYSRRCKTLKIPCVKRPGALKRCAATRVRGNRTDVALVCCGYRIDLTRSKMEVARSGQNGFGMTGSINPKSYDSKICFENGVGVYLDHGIIIRGAICVDHRLSFRETY